MQEKPIIGISTCLLGHKVRYDGGHKYDSWLVETLGQFVDYFPVCPEVECGLPVPREAMRLVGKAEDPLLLTIKSGIDHTPRMKAWSARKIEELAGKNLCAYVFKSKSPSSGMERVKVYPAAGGAASKTGVGMFAREFMKAFPLIPVEEEGRLHDPILRENFIERIFVVWRWQQLLSEGGSPKAIVDFHTRHKLLLMAHSPLLYRELGKLVAEQKRVSLDEFKGLYFAKLMQAMKLHATSAKHMNVLQHIMGYFKKDLEPVEKTELLQIIEDFRAGLYPLIVPVTLLNHYVRKYRQEYLLGQYYLNPHPLELKLRNHS
ncbi:MAG TPA: DUF523 and DUF1722 domain-containing protein [Candidatus Cloacimonadota bacterium]|nr:DUF523 and DUF1722 domain-containing protein [Candidatus Cloacimonadota bacterium]